MLSLVLTDLAARGYLPENTLVWATGRAEWQPVRDVPEIWKDLNIPLSAGPSDGQTAPDASFSADESTNFAGAPQTAVPEQGLSQRGAVKTAVVAAKAVKANVAPVDRELAAFQAEMSALGATNAPAADNIGVDEPARAETPPPEDQRFQDDDGTWFVWDSSLRRFIEEVSSIQWQYTSGICLTP